MKKITFLFFLGLCLTSYVSTAQVEYSETESYESKIHFDNNSSIPLESWVTRSGASIDNSDWGYHDTDVAPWRGGLTLMKTNRNSGLGCGNDFFFQKSIHRHYSHP